MIFVSVRMINRKRKVGMTWGCIPRHDLNTMIGIPITLSVIQQDEPDAGWKLQTRKEGASRWVDWK